MENNVRVVEDYRFNPEFVDIGEGAVIDTNVMLGYLPSRGKITPVSIGYGAHIRSGTVIYASSRIGNGLETGHYVVIREENTIGDNLRIWNNSVIDYGCQIENDVKIHNKVYIGQYTVIEDEVFIAPGVTLANDIHPGCPDSLQCMHGPHIKKGAQIGINCSILPKVVIGERSVIGAGSVVTRDIPAGVVAYGNPAQVVCEIGEIKCITGFRDKPYGHLIKRS